MKRQRVRRRLCNGLLLLACAPIAGVMAFSGDFIFAILSPKITAAMSRFGWTNRTITEVTIDIHAEDTVVIVGILCAVGLIATLLALCVAGPWHRRKPRWTRAVRDLLPALAIGILPWTALVVMSESASHIMGLDDRASAVSLVYIFGGPAASLLTYRLTRGGWRRWKLCRANGHIPREPCGRCGYELLRTLGHDGIKRCPECGAEQSLKNSPAQAKNADS